MSLLGGNNPRIRDWEDRVMQLIREFAAGQATPLTQPGDVLTRDATQNIRLGIGAENSILSVSSLGMPTWSSILQRIDELGDAVTITVSYDVAPDSEAYLFFTATPGNNIVKLPDPVADSLTSAWKITLVNLPSSTAIIQVQDSAGTPLGRLAVGSTDSFVLTTTNAWAEINLPFTGEFHVLSVSKGAEGDFQTIKEALDSIVDASPTNFYMVDVGIGIFVEDNPLVVPSNTCIVGQQPHVTVVVAANPTLVLIQLETQANASNIAFTGASGVGGVGLLIDSATTQVTRVIFTNCETCIRVTAAQVGVPCTCLINNCTFTGAVTTAVELDGSAGSSVEGVLVQLRDNAYISNGFTGSAVYVHGALAQLIAQGEGMSRPPPAVGVGYHIGDDASGFLVGCGAGGLATAFLVDATGSGGPANFPKMYLSGCVASNSTVDIDILNATTQGFVSGQFDSAKISIVAGATVAANFVDISLTTDPRVNITGDFWYGPDWNRQTDLAPFFSEASSKGLLIDGGLASGVAPDAVDVSAGSGYLETLALGVAALHYVVWPAATLDLLSTPALVNNENNYIFVDSAGVLGVSVARPNDTTTILLGRAFLSGGDRVFVDASPVNSHVPVNHAQRYDRDVFRGLFSRGCLASTSALGTSTDLSVTSGLYYFSHNPFEPVGLDSTGGSAAPILASFVQLNTDGGGAFVYAAGVTAVNDTVFDNGTGTTALTGTQHAKHALYVVGGDGGNGNEQYFLQLSQAAYANLTAAQNAGIPTPPVSGSGDIFFEGMVRVSSIIIENGGGIVQIDDIRPTPVSSPPTGGGGGGGVPDHCDLAGLNVDCHVQYLPLTGVRVMTGDLQMGINNIITSGLVDGVDVSSHAARHLPTGVDALATAAPTVTLGSGTSNQEGTANSFARSDHVHAIDVGSIAHSALAGLTVGDDHTQYALLAGRGVGQILTGATSSAGTLTLTSTSNATKGNVNINNIAILPNSDIRMGTAAVPASIVWDWSLVDPANVAYKGLGIGFGKIERWRSDGSTLAGSAQAMGALAGFPAVRQYTGSQRQGYAHSAPVGVALTAAAFPGDIVDVLVDGITTVIVDAATLFGPINAGSVGILRGSVTPGRVVFNTLGNASNEAKLCFCLETPSVYAAGALVLVRLLSSFDGY